MSLEKMHLERKNELIEAIREALNQFSEDTRLYLVKYFQKRMIKYIESNEDRTSYK